MDEASSEKLEKIFQKYFQRNIELYINGELYKKGKFLLLDNKVIGNNYFYEFFIERTKKVDCVKIPYPFNVEEHEEDSMIYLDFRLKKFSNNKNTNNKIIKLLDSKPLESIPSRLFNNILEIKFN